MKHSLIFMAILFAGVRIGLSQPGEISLIGVDALDSTVGKSPTYSLALPSDMDSIKATIGKSPVVLYRDGPPPHGSGPGLRFNTKEWFYVYTDRGAAPNHFIPSGWMGDYEDLQLDTNSRDNPADGKTCIKITYAPENAGIGWAGMYWQDPVNNWGDKTGGFNLKGMKQLTFWARGAQGGEVINEFKVGGIQGSRPDSDSVAIGPIVLTSDWKQYVIDVSQTDLSHISGGFAWSASADDNPNGMTFYLDEIRFER